MKITVTESGGWANIGRTCTLDTAGLPKGDARSLEAAISKLVSLPAVNAPHARDARTITIMILADNCERTLSFSEAQAPPAADIVLKIVRPFCAPVPNRRA